MSYKIKRYNSFKKDIKRCKKRRYDFSLLKTVVGKLKENGKLPKKYKTHKLRGDYRGYLECHIRPDWLLIWKQDRKSRTIFLERTGTHSDLFE